MNILQATIEGHGVTEPFFGIPGLDIERRGERGRTCLISACVPTVISHETYRSDLPRPTVVKPAVITRLLELGAAVDAVDDEGRTALHWIFTMAASYNDEDKTAFSELLSKEPSLIHAKDAHGATPFNLAA